MVAVSPLSALASSRHVNPNPPRFPFPRYEFLSSQEVADVVGAALGEKSSAEAACVALVEQAALLWRREEDDYRDDITAIVVQLNPFALMRKEAEESPRGDCHLFGPRRSLDDLVAKEVAVVG